MRPPISIRAVTPDEQQAIAAGLHSPASFTLRRCQILRASQRGLHAQPIADHLGCDDQTVRNAITAFNQRGLAALHARSSAPRHRPQAVFDAARRERLRDLLQQRPRTFGHATSGWSLPLAATVAYAEGFTPRAVSGAAIRLALRQLGVGWQRAKHWITSPEPAYCRKKTDATG